MLKLARRARGHFVTLIENRVHVKPGHISRTGETNVMAGLRQCGVYIQSWRVRESIARVDPSHQQGKEMGTNNITLVIQ